MATTRTYQELVDLVYMWSNRDRDALPVGIVQDSIRYAVDKAYRHLRIPPLEYTVRYTADALQAATVGENNILQSVTALSVPSDLVEFIQIRGVDADGQTTRVFNQKNDIRSYWDINNRNYTRQSFWSRQGDQILLTPAFGQIGSGYYGGFTSAEACIELFYYRRLSALDATFNETYTNWVNRLGIFSDGTVYSRELADATNLQNYTTAAENDTVTWTGMEVPNWFRDENERIALYGALAECFAYLQEDDQAGKYTQLMMKEIEELNEEDRIRDSSGGNVQVQYNARGLL